MTSSPLDVNRFVQERGRLPHLGDEVPPWRYRGWLLYYAQLAHAVAPATGNRWEYWMRTLEAGRPLPEPIPVVHFETRAVGQSNSAPVKSVQQALRTIENSRHSIWDSFRLFIGWLGWGLATSRLETELDDDVQERLYRDFNLQPWLEHPGDHLGEFLASTKASGWNPTAFFPTPHALCDLMVEMTMGDLDAVPADGRDARLTTICDPAVGTGRMLLHAAGRSFCLYGQDIDPLVAEICRINGALYAPWLAFPMPAAMLGNLVASHWGPSPLILAQAEPSPEELAAIAAAVKTAQELATSVTVVETMAISRSGQGLLFQTTMEEPERGRRRGSRAAAKNESTNEKEAFDDVQEKC